MEVFERDIVRMVLRNVKALTPRCKRIKGYAGRASGRPCAPLPSRALGFMNYKVGPASWWARVTRQVIYGGG